MDYSEFRDRICDELAARFEEAGRGSMSRATEALGFNRDYFRQWRIGTVRFQSLLPTLDLMGTDIRDFLAAALGERKVDREGGARKTPLDVQAILNDKRPEPMANATDERVQQIVHARDEDPRRAVELSLRFLRESETVEEGIVFACELGASERAAGLIADSIDTLYSAYAKAQEMGRHDLMAGALWRLAFTFVVTGKLQKATRTSEEAIMAAAAGWAREELGLAFVAKGSSLFHQGKYRRAKADYTAAVNLVEQPLNRMAAAGNLYNTCLKLGERLQALPFDVDFEDVPTSMKVDIWWVQASVKSPEQALAPLNSLYQWFVEREDWHNAALAAAELLETFFQAGHVREAKEFAVAAGAVAFKMEPCPLESALTTVSKNSASERGRAQKRCKTPSSRSKARFPASLH